MLQVLLSIQALILCKDPYFNEAGYESLRNTEEVPPFNTSGNTRY
jgi:hypothetical protein